MRKCSECGSLVRDDGSKCGVCGASPTEEGSGIWQQARAQNPFFPDESRVGKIEIIMLWLGLALAALGVFGLFFAGALALAILIPGLFLALVGIQRIVNQHNA